MVESQLPIFSYGTLMPGQPNYDLWADLIVHTEPAVFPGGRLHHLGYFPMLSEGGLDPVHGFLVKIAAHRYDSCLQDLDYLENYQPDNLEDSLYHRLERTILLAEGRTMRAWVYVGNPLVSARYPIIPSGDWRQATL